MRIGDFNIASFLGAIENEVESLAGGGAAGQSAQALALGSSGELLPGQERTIPNDDSMPDFYQGQTNGCGTTSLAMIMSYLGVPETQGDIDAAIRRADIFTNPTDILDFARSKGLSAEGYNHGSLDQLKGFIDQGIPCQALIDVTGDGNPANMHYVAVVGYGKDSSGNPYVKIHDPATGQTTDVPESQFEKQWSNTPFGFDHYFNAFAPGGTQLPPSNFDGIEGTLAAADGLTNVTNGFERLVHPNNVGDFVHGLFQVPGGVVEGIGGAVGTGIELGADWLKNATKDIPVLGSIVAPISDVLHGVGAGVGDVFRGVGSAIDDIGGAFGSLFSGDFGGFFGGLFNGAGSLFSGLFNGVGDVLGGVAQGFGDAVSSVGNAISSGISAVGDFLGSIF
jgi:hypothetical protein